MTVVSASIDHQMPPARNPSTLAAVDLSESQAFPLGDSAEYALIGVGWNVSSYEGDYDSGVFDIDVDAFVFLDDANGKAHSNDDLFYHWSLSRDGHAITLECDFLDGCIHDEYEIYVDFSKVPDWVQVIAIYAVMCDAANRCQSFSQVTSGYVRADRLQDYWDSGSETILCFKYGSSFGAESTVNVCEIRRCEEGWKFEAQATSFQGDVRELCCSSWYREGQSCGKD